MKKIISKIACIFLLVFTCNTLLAQNLLTINPSFELGKKGWYFDSKDGVADVVPDNVHGGKAALKLTSLEGKGVKFFYSRPEEQALAFKAGKTYQLKVWVKVLVPTRHIDLRVYASAGFKESEDITVSVKAKGLKTNEWQQITFDFKGKDYEKGKFAIGVNLGEVIFDDVELVEL